MLNLSQKTDSKVRITPKTLFYIHEPETLQRSAPQREQNKNGKIRVDMLFQRGMTLALT